MYLLGKDDSWKMEFHERPKSRRKVKIIRTTTIEPYVKDYCFFTLAPLYVHAGVMYSMPDQFEIEAGEQDRVLVNYQRTIINGLGSWGNLVEGISSNVWDDFCHYLSTVLFVSFDKKLVWMARSHDLDVEGTDNSGRILSPGRLPVRLKVFLPDGNRGRMFIKGGCPAKLWMDKPQREICKMADKILNCHGRIEDASLIFLRRRNLTLRQLLT